SQGRIERLYVNYQLQPVRKGQKLFEIYSPELVTAQKELLYLLESDPQGRLTEAARQKLRLLGLTPSQISRLAESGEVSYSLAVYSPYDGYVYETPAGGGPAAAVTAASPLNIREGMYLKSGEAVFKVVNAARVWAELTVYPKDAPYIRKGEPLTLTAYQDEDLKVAARADLILPFYREGETFTKVRVYLDNAGTRLMPGQLVKAEFRSLSDSAWWIPAAAVLDLGLKHIVFVKEKQDFRPRVIAVGRQSGQWIEVLSGLSPTDSIAPDGHYISDSEGFIRTNDHE
ncbi:MAG TPA: efflux RND transporter periplasmic adaptor subunit, partial [Anseongella sp.]|nr:efflux RND transporter periplasmic adaptor subunit [Anseongella sp.]